MTFPSIVESSSIQSDIVRVLVFNPGSNSLKFEVVETAPGQQYAWGGRKLLSVAVESFGKPGKQATLSVLDGRTTSHQEDVDVKDFPSATKLAVEWIGSQCDDVLHGIDLVGVRVVHGGTYFERATRYDESVRQKIESLEDLAPLHNRSSLAIIDAIAPALPKLPIAVTLDTAFHRTLPEVAWRYPIHRETADRHGIRKFGFHGVSHRYMLERYAELAGKAPDACSLVTLHLESGSSACAIRNGQSVDTSMGLTPLEGLMMGSRSGSVDPAIVEVLVRKENLSAEEAVNLLNKQSGLLGIGGDLDTRVLARRNDEHARLALDMYAYRVRLMVGAYLAALGNAEAVVFGAGIGEDSPAIRAAVCEGLGHAGLELDRAVNEAAISGEAKLTTEQSKLVAWSMPSEEGLQIAHECAIAMAGA